MHDLEDDPETESTYECLNCGEIITSTGRPSECSDCGRSESFRNRAFALE